MSDDTDPMTPAPPEAARFDSAQNAWVLSRYRDVSAALRDPHLWPVDGKREIQPDGRDADGRLPQRGAMLEAIAGARVDAWRPQVEALTRSAIANLPANRAVDLLEEFTLPWGLSLAMLVTGADAGERRRLSELSTRVFAATGAESKDAALKADAAAATAELERRFEGGPVPMGEPAFVALSQTLPRLLANVWLALVRHPSEYERLRAQPQLLPAAIDELLRFAGIVRHVYRRATKDVDISGTRIAAGELAVLMLGSANRDPEAFSDPDRFDVGRGASHHLSLGTGRNSCVGAMLIRMAASTATAALTGEFARVEFEGVGDWRTGSGFRFPGSLIVRLQRLETLLT
jgi:cytochrome P450